MPGTLKRTFGPIALTTTMTTNIYNQGSALIYDVIRHIHVDNKLAADSFNLYLGATGANAAGTELFFQYPVAAKGSFDYYCALKMLSTDFLVGGAATTLTLTILGEGEQYVV
jgi:hypothetical protein